MDTTHIATDISKDISGVISADMFWDISTDMFSDIWFMQFQQSLKISTSQPGYTKVYTQEYTLIYLSTAKYTAVTIRIFWYDFPVIGFRCNWKSPKVTNE